MSEHNRGSHDDALYKSTYTLLSFSLRNRPFFPELLHVGKNTRKQHLLVDNRGRFFYSPSSRQTNSIKAVLCFLVFINLVVPWQTRSSVTAWWDICACDTSNTNNGPCMTWVIQIPAFHTCLSSFSSSVRCSTLRGSGLLIICISITCYYVINTH